MIYVYLTLIGCVVGAVLGYRDYRKSQRRNKEYTARIARVMATLPPVHTADPAPLMKIVDRYGHEVDLNKKVNDFSFGGK